MLTNQQQQQTRKLHNTCREVLGEGASLQIDVMILTMTFNSCYSRMRSALHSMCTSGQGPLQVWYHDNIGLDVVVHPHMSGCWTNMTVIGFCQGLSQAWNAGVR